MNAYGIKFINRAKADDGADPSRNRSEFMEFAAMCESFGVARYVHAVMFDGNISSFYIYVDESHEKDDVGGRLHLAADATLSQYILFGCCYHKHGLESGV